MPLQMHRFSRVFIRQQVGTGGRPEGQRVLAHVFSIKMFKGNTIYPELGCLLILLPY